MQDYTATIIERGRKTRLLKAQITIRNRILSRPKHEKGI